MPDTDTKPVNRPALPCPSWCATRHESYGDTFTSHQMHRPTGDVHGSYVTLYMNDYGTDSPALASYNGAVDIHLTRDPGAGHKSIIRPVAEAENFARDAEVFGRDDIANLIREVAAIAQKEPQPQRQPQ